MMVMHAHWSIAGRVLVTPRWLEKLPAGGCMCGSEAPQARDNSTGRCCQRIVTREECTRMLQRPVTANVPHRSSQHLPWRKP